MLGKMDCDLISPLLLADPIQIFRELTTKPKGCLIKYLPPYSPDYNPIELTFSILKAWMRRHFEAFRHVFQNDFKGFLRYAIENSSCDRFAIKYIGRRRYKGHS